MNTHPLLPFRYLLFAASLLAIFSLPGSASALVMRPGHGPEPVIVQIRESLRLSDDLDDSLGDLAQLEAEAGVTVEKWWAGPKLLQLVSFPKDFSEEQAMEVIGALEELSAVERVVPVSGFNLEYKGGDFIRAYKPGQDIPEAALRGLASEQSSCLATKCDVEEAVNAPHVPNQLIVGWKREYAWRADQTGFCEGIADLHHSAGAHVVHEMTPTPTDLIQVIEFDDPETSLLEKLKEYEKSEWVEYVQPNYVYSRYVVGPNDPYYTNPGQPNLARISAPLAWSVETGDSSVVVAVADSGLNTQHPDFADRLSTGQHHFDQNPKHDSDDVLDDDPIGPFHGSHVASIIGARGNNNLFMSGVAWDVRLLILKGDTDSAIGVRMIDYAYSDQGHPRAIAINCSWGLGPRNCLDRALTDAVRRAKRNNMVVVAAAGNFGLDLDLSSNLITPASVPTDNVITVGATRLRPDTPALNDTKPDFSDYGKYRVELGAPGGEDGEENTLLHGILGLSRFYSDPCNPAVYNYFGSCRRMSGTSQAAPQVVGALALVKSKYPLEDYAGIRDRVIMGIDEKDVLNPYVFNGFRTGGRLNLAKALKPRTLIKNLSTRAKVESGDRIVIGGFVIHGGPCTGRTPCETLKVVIRGLGPTLPSSLSSRLSDPKLRLNNSHGKELAVNNDWQDDPAQAAALTALGLAPTDQHEAAMVQTLQPGSYTVFLQSQNGQEGIGLFEIYEIRGTTSENTRLVNLSTRCPVGSGDNVAIAGTILQNPAQGLNQPNSDFPKRRILTFGRGPSLQLFGLTGFLPNPYLEFHDSNSTIAFNDQWKDIDGTGSTGLEDKLVENKFMPCATAAEQYLNDSAVWPMLQPGPYTAILSDAGSGNGIALVEFYEQ